MVTNAKRKNMQKLLDLKKVLAPRWWWLSSAFPLSQWLMIMTVLVTDGFYQLLRLQRMKNKQYARVPDFAPNNRASSLRKLPPIDNSSPATPRLYNKQAAVGATLIAYPWDANLFLFCSVLQRSWPHRVCVCIWVNETNTITYFLPAMCRHRSGID